MARIARFYRVGDYTISSADQCHETKLPAQNPKSIFFSMKVSGSVSMDSLISQPVPPTGDTVANSTLADVVLVSSALFDGIFGAGDVDSINPNSGQSSQPDLTGFMYVSHVKNVNVTNLPGEKKATDGDVGQFSVTVWPCTVQGWHQAICARRLSTECCRTYRPSFW